MASATTFSPDALHGGPVVATLCGKLDEDFGKTRIDRGDIIFVDQERKIIQSYLEYENINVDKYGETQFFFPNEFSMAIAAEAVTFTHNQLKHKADIYVPVVVYGRTIVNVTIPNEEGMARKIEFRGGDTAYIDNNKDLHAHAPLAMGEFPFLFNTYRTYYKITFIQSKDTIFSSKDPLKTTPVDVFVEPYQTPGGMTESETNAIDAVNEETEDEEEDFSSGSENEE